MRWQYITDWSHVAPLDRPADPLIIPKLDAQGEKPLALNAVDSCFITEATAERFGEQWVRDDLVPHRAISSSPFFHCFQTMSMFATPDGQTPSQRVWVQRLPTSADDIYQADTPVQDAELFRIKLSTTDEEVQSARHRGALRGAFPRHLYNDLKSFEKKALDAYTDFEYSPTNVIHFNSSGAWQMLDANYFVVASDSASTYQWMRTGANIDDAFTPSNAYLDASKSMNSPRNLLWTEPFVAPAHKGDVAVQVDYSIVISELMPGHFDRGFTRFGYARRYCEGIYDEQSQRAAVSGTQEIGRSRCIDVVERVFPGWGQLHSGQGEQPPEGFYRMCRVDAAISRVFFQLDLETTLN